MNLGIHTPNLEVSEKIEALILSLLNLPNPRPHPTCQIALPFNDLRSNFEASHIYETV